MGGAASGLLECAAAGVAAPRALERASARLAVGHEIDAGNVVDGYTKEMAYDDLFHGIIESIVYTRAKVYSDKSLYNEALEEAERRKSENMKKIILMSIICINLFSWDFNYNELTENETKLTNKLIKIGEPHGLGLELAAIGIIETRLGKYESNNAKACCSKLLFITYPITFVGGES